jgi:DUF1009 family protein
MEPKLGIVAGGGDLPERLVEACRAKGRPFFVLAIEGQADPARFAGMPCSTVRLGALERAFGLLREHGVEEVVFSGAFRRPSLAALRPDGRALRFLARYGGRLMSDDRLINGLIEMCEREEGFRVVAADSVLAGLLANEGALGRHAPTEEERRDIDTGIEVATTLGRMDVGQAVVVHQGIVLGVEAIEGTDALIRRCGDLRREESGGVLVKVRKPQQESRADPPVIGPATVETGRQARLRGVAFDVEGTLVLDRDVLVQAADAAGMFVVGVRVDRRS